MRPDHANGTSDTNRTDDTSSGNGARPARPTRTEQLLQERAEPFDLAIVGAGPVGIEMHVAAKQAGMRVIHADAGCIGHTMSWWAPGTRWFSSNERISIAGVPLVTSDQSKATREQYLSYLRAVVTHFDLSILTYTRVTSVTRQPDGLFDVRAESSRGPTACLARHVVLAVGGTDRPNRLGVEGESLPHVSGYLGEPHKYFDRRVVVVGGRNSAVEAALRIYHAGGRVTLVYRGAELPEKSIKYWLFPELRGLVRDGCIELLLSTHVQKITPTHVTVRHENTTRDIPADDVLTLIGYTQDKTLFEQIGIPLCEPCDHPAHNPETMETKIPNLYVAGTAIAGTQSSDYGIFLENCHVHVGRIMRAMGLTQEVSRERKFTSAES